MELCIPPLLVLLQYAYQKTEADRIVRDEQTGLAKTF